MRGLARRVEAELAARQRHQLIGERLRLDLVADDLTEPHLVLFARVLAGAWVDIDREGVDCLAEQSDLHPQRLRESRRDAACEDDVVDMDGQTAGREVFGARAVPCFPQERRRRLRTAVEVR